MTRVLGCKTRDSMTREEDVSVVCALTSTAVRASFAVRGGRWRWRRQTRGATAERL